METVSAAVAPVPLPVGHNQKPYLIANLADLDSF